MEAARLPGDENARIEALEGFEILDTVPEQVFDDIAELASQICGTPIALISFVDRDRQWFKSRVGVEVEETPREIAFCSHAILEPDQLFMIEDAAIDLRFADNPLTVSGNFRFYAGVPLRVNGLMSGIGTLCVADRRPRELDEDQQKALRALARQVEGQLQLRKALRDLERHQERLEEYEQSLEEANQMLAHQRFTDPTGVSNRHAFDRRLSEEFDRALRYGHSLALLLIDADNFKDYNDTLGHGAGDEALHHLAEILTKSSRSTDDVARYGGDEFAMILPETTLNGAVVIAERARKSVETALWDRPITISVGAASLLPSDHSALDLVNRADGALYEAKGQGHNCVVEAPEEH